MGSASVDLDHHRSNDHDQMTDFESTTVTLRRLAPGLAWLPRPIREHLTPAALWSAIGALAIAIGYILNAQVDLHRHQESIVNLQSEMGKERELLQTIDTRLAVMGNKIDDIGSEVNRQREWRERIESVAESPSHIRRYRP